jgi:glucose 1-dehydrogenase
MSGVLEGRTALVTGADSGIGRATAAAFARAGADVAVCYRTDQAGAEGTRRLVEEAGRRAIVRRADVRDESQVERLVEETCAALGAPHVLVNDAGIGGSGRSVADTPTAEWDDVLKTDLYGPFFLCRAFVRRRRAEGGGGRIVNVTSVHDAIPSPGNAAYGAAKGGLKTLTRTLALELAPDRIAVNAVAPGLIETPMTEDKLAERRGELERHIPWGRAGRPEEVARLILYLASDEADYVTGQAFVIDGGLEMRWGQGA